MQQVQRQQAMHMTIHLKTLLLVHAGQLQSLPHDAQPSSGSQACANAVNVIDIPAAPAKSEHGHTVRVIRVT